LQLGLNNLMTGVQLPVVGVPEEKKLAEALPVHLTRREREILGCLEEGLADKAIALRLDIAHATVRSRLPVLYGKLGVHTRSEAVVWVRNNEEGNR
jgi:DNA-binding NarL/FixJ family response regulator